MKTAALLILFLIALSCANSNNEKTKDTVQHLELTKSDTLSVFLSHYTLSNSRDVKKIETTAQLPDAFKGYNNKDILYISVHDAFPDKIDSTLQLLQQLGITNYRIDVTRNFWTLPYPNTRLTLNSDTTQ